MHYAPHALLYCVVWISFASGGHIVKSSLPSTENVVENAPGPHDQDSAASETNSIVQKLSEKSVDRKRQAEPQSPAGDPREPGNFGPDPRQLGIPNGYNGGEGFGNAGFGPNFGPSGNFGSPGSGNFGQGTGSNNFGPGVGANNFGPGVGANNFGPGFGSRPSSPNSLFNNQNGGNRNFEFERQYQFRYPAYPNQQISQNYFGQGISPLGLNDPRFLPPQLPNIPFPQGFGGPNNIPETNIINNPNPNDNDNNNNNRDDGKSSEENNGNVPINTLRNLEPNNQRSGPNPADRPNPNNPGLPSVAVGPVGPEQSRGNINLDNQLATGIGYERIRQNFYNYPERQFFTQFDPLSAGAGGFRAFAGNRPVNGNPIFNENNQPPPQQSIPSNIPAEAVGQLRNANPQRNNENLGGGAFNYPDDGGYFGNSIFRGPPLQPGLNYNYPGNGLVPGNRPGFGNFDRLNSRASFGLGGANLFGFLPQAQAGNSNGVNAAGATGAASGNNDAGKADSSGKASSPASVAEKAPAAAIIGDSDDKRESSEDKSTE